MKFMQEGKSGIELSCEPFTMKKKKKKNRSKTETQKALVKSSKIAPLQY